jgi:hypothetical protein
MGGLLGLITGSSGAKKGAKIQAAATLKAANDTAGNDRLIAQAAQQSRETMLAQDNASRSAAELLNKPMGMADVQLASSDSAAEIDPDTGRRRTRRSTYTSKSPTSGVRI